jgi:hypothetical protein
LFKYKELITPIKEKTPVSKDSWRVGSEDNANIEIDGEFKGRVTLPKQHGAHDVKKGTQEAIRKQLLLDKEQFKKYIKCTLTRSDYSDLIREKYP